MHEPRWPALTAMVAASLMYFSLPEPLSLGPRWLLLAVTLFLLIPITATYRRGRHDLTRIFTLVANGVITVALMASLFFLVRGLPEHRESPQNLLGSAAALWVTNILVFALWYWKLDAGGPFGRESRRGPLESSFLFPQMTAQGGSHENWSPHFIDYLFLAFNTSTAFSPTDTAVLSRWAKVGMMLQSLTSLTILALLAARAINIL